jgi:succinyl-diaminopimelate desuccinylase
MLDFAVEAEKYREEFLRLLTEGISIKSFYEEASVQETMPFGKGVAEFLEWFIKLGGDNGFKTKNVDGYAAHIEYGTGEEYIYAFAHCDVVPAGDGWESEPFKLLKLGDKLIGRGVIDDKGPLIASYLALKLLKDNNILPNRNIRVVAGGNEESGFRCIRHYFQKEPKPTYGFTPDAKFPVINGEMGAVVVNISGSIENKNMVVKGGQVHNTIPGYITIAGCNIREREEKVKNFLQKENIKIQYIDNENMDPGIKIIGTGGHSSKPEKANNPIEKMFKLFNLALQEASFSELLKLFGGDNRDGNLFGLNKSGKCGEFKLVPTIIEIEDGKINLTLSVRYPEVLTVDEITKKIREYFESHGLDDYKAHSSGIKKPSYVDENSPMIKRLYEIYLKHSGDTINKVRVTSAGTYASEMENTVVFGGEFPDGSSGNTHMNDEYASENAFIRSIGIYAEAIYELSELELNKCHL